MVFGWYGVTLLKPYMRLVFFWMVLLVVDGILGTVFRMLASFVDSWLLFGIFACRAEGVLISSSCFH